MGFVPRYGVNNLKVRVDRGFRPAALSKWLREFRPHWVGDRFTKQRDGALESWYQDCHFLFNLQDGSTFEPGINANTEEIR